MPVDVGPRVLQRASHAGFRRLQNFRDARTMFIRQYVGQYYDQRKGSIGSEPLNLIFNAIRILVPNLVSNFPEYNVTTEYLPYRNYAELLGKALTLNGKQIDIRTTYRRAIVDAIFTMGIMKTGIATSHDKVFYEGDLAISPGEIYTDVVDFDNFTFDPSVRGDIRESAFFGDRSIVSREKLMESGLYNNALIERLPSVSGQGEMRERASNLSMRSWNERDGRIEDEVEITELWVPEANATVTVPGATNVSFEEYLRVEDYDGTDDGPYTLLTFTPPVPGNPLPVAMVGIWHDLHVMANKMAVKIMEQADRQKDIIGYKPASADDAIEARDAVDGEAVAMEDPDGLRVHSFGGQQSSNEAHVIQLQQWFNMVAANPQGVGGQDLRSGSATEASILQQNAGIGLADMIDMTYIAGAGEARKRALRLHTDPLIEIPLVRRQLVPTPNGPQRMDVQVFLTPEARSGEFFDFAFEVQRDSMQRVDQQQRFERAFDFGARILPAAVNAALMSFQAGVPFNLQTYLGWMAKEAGIEWMDEVFEDPTFQQRIQLEFQRGPQFQTSTGIPKPPEPPPLQSNGTSPLSAGEQPDLTDQFLQESQSGANQSQRNLQGTFSPSTTS